MRKIKVISDIDRKIKVFQEYSRQANTKKLQESPTDWNKLVMLITLAAEELFQLAYFSKDVKKAEKTKIHKYLSRIILGENNIVRIHLRVKLLDTVKKLSKY